MQASGHPSSQQLKEMTNEMQKLYRDFETRFADRKKLLESMIEFFSVAQEVGVAREGVGAAWVTGVWLWKV
jgi:hypothetical protein